MALVGVDVLSAASPVSSVSKPDTTLRPLSRKRRMNFFDIANLLDSDGNLQNEMIVFAFAATMLSTIPILLGNEFDINVGLKRKRRQAGLYEDPDESENMNFPLTGFTSGFTYKTLMNSVTGAHTFCNHGGSPVEDPADASLNGLLENLLQWSQRELKKRSLLSNFVMLMLGRHNSESNPADKFVVYIYNKWRKYWYQ